MKREIKFRAKDFVAEEPIGQCTGLKRPQTYALVNYSIFSTKPEIAKPLTPKQYGQSLVNQKKKRK